MSMDYLSGLERFVPVYDLHINFHLIKRCIKGTYTSGQLSNTHGFTYLFRFYLIQITQ